MLCGSATGGMPGSTAIGGPTAAVDVRAVDAVDGAVNDRAVVAALIPDIPAIAVGVTEVAVEDDRGGWIAGVPPDDGFAEVTPAGVPPEEDPPEVHAVSNNAAATSTRQRLRPRNLRIDDPFLRWHSAIGY